MHQTMSTRLASLLLVCGLVGCGDSDDGPGTPRGPTATDGGATPKALLARAKAAADSENLPELFASIYPRHRAGLAYFMGVMPIQMMIGMAEKHGLGTANLDEIGVREIELV